MRRARGFWLLALLSASCAVRGFTIDDYLPGAGGGSAGMGVAGSLAGGAGSANQGGNGTSGAMTQGGKGGVAGSESAAGSPVADAGDTSIGQGGEGGAAPAGPLAACDESNGVPPLFCEDFQSGAFDLTKWNPPAGFGVTPDQGPLGQTKLVHLEGPELPTTFGDFSFTGAKAVTLSFWIKPVGLMSGAVVASFHDRSAQVTTLRVSMIQKELGWTGSGTNVHVPDTATQAQLVSDKWTCVSIYVTSASMVLSYQTQGSATVSTLTVDDTATPGMDASWHNQVPEHRYVGGFPAFGGTVNGVATELYLDDVRISTDASSVCPF